MNTLPHGWEKTQFSDALERIVGGGTPSKAVASNFSGNIPFMTVKDLNERFPKDTIDHINSEAVENSATTIVPSDTLIIATRMALGKIARPCRPTAINQDLKGLFLKDGFDKTYIEFLWRSLAQHIQTLGTGTTVKGIRIEDIRNLEIPVPPSAEQKRIADKLELVIGRVDACRNRLDRVPSLLKRFRQSVLAAATSGRLTEEWRVINRVNEEWKEVKVLDVADQVFDGPFGSHLKTIDYTASGVRVARLENIGWMTFLAKKEAFISPAKYKTLTRHTLKKNDVVFSSFISEEIRVALLPDSWSGKAINKSDCYCVRVDQKCCLPKFLMLRLACRSTFHLLGEDIHGATRPRINLAQLKNFTFSLPSLPEQKEIVRRVESLFSMAERIEIRIDTAKKTVECLTPATLAKAFRGELIPQDPKDESASVLLTRLKDQNALIISTPKKRPAAKAAKKPAKMEKMKLIEIIVAEFGKRKFSFDELRQKVTDLTYDTLQEQLFELIELKGGAGITMKFNKSKERMEFKAN